MFCEDILKAIQQSLITAIVYELLSYGSTGEVIWSHETNRRHIWELSFHRIHQKIARDMPLCSCIEP